MFTLTWNTNIWHKYRCIFVYPITWKNYVHIYRTGKEKTHMQFPKRIAPAIKSSALLRFRISTLLPVKDINPSQLSECRAMIKLWILLGLMIFTICEHGFKPLEWPDLRLDDCQNLFKACPSNTFSLPQAGEEFNHVNICSSVLTLVSIGWFNL